MSVADILLPQSGLDRGALFGSAIASAVRAGNPMAALTSPFTGAVWFSSPSGRIGKGPKSFGAAKRRILGMPEPNSPNRPRMPKMAGLASAMGAAFRRQHVPIVEPQGLLQRLRQAVTNPIAPTILPSTQSGGLKWWIKIPLVSTGLGVTGYGAWKGMDYLQDQADNITRARAYRDMVNMYGNELRASLQNEEVPITEEKLQSMFGALFKVAPDIATNPTLAATQMNSLIKGDLSHRQMDENERRAIIDGKEVDLVIPRSIIPFSQSAEIQKVMPRRLRPSEFAAGGGRYISDFAKTIGVGGPTGITEADVLRAQMMELGKRKTRSLVDEVIRRRGYGPDMEGQAIDAVTQTLLRGR